MNHLTYQKNELTGAVWVKMPGQGWITGDAYVRSFLEFYQRQSKGRRRRILRDMRSCLPFDDYTKILRGLELAALDLARERIAGGE